MFDLFSTHPRVYASRKNNNLQGSLDFTRLPKSVGYISLDGKVAEFWGICKKEHGTGTLGFEFLPCSMKTMGMYTTALSGTIQLADVPVEIERVYPNVNKLTGSLKLENLPNGLGYLELEDNKLTADPMEGHLFVVGWTSTPSWGKPGAFQTLVVFLFWRRPYRRPPQGGGSGPVPIHGEVQETVVSGYGGSRILLVARRENVHSFSVD
ncbi:hypothetical protein XU18_4226 [Perkinsela sp. CCAP 1560/4]|nr:hypothetical protein XU18_4226 [Perkinsela sp. CCAP 1560/4]|eukprot:KNH04542.1 hypothetical protein XU18_4226 [Perkinsela sp. CCAP 1560/4]